MVTAEILVIEYVNLFLPQREGVEGRSMRSMLSNASIIRGKMINVELMAWLEAVVLATYWGEENVPNCEMSQLGYSIFLRRKFYDTFKKKFLHFMHIRVHIYIIIIWWSNWGTWYMLTLKLLTLSCLWYMLHLYIFIFRKLL